MFEKLFYRNETQSAELDLLESLLDVTLTPVSPRPDFVGNLRRQLLVDDLQAQIVTPANVIPRGLLVAGGIVGSLIVVLTSIHGLVSMIGVISLLVQQIRRSASPKTAAFS